VAAKRYQSNRGSIDGNGSSGCGGKMAAQPCNIIMAVQSERDIINWRWQ